MTEENKNLTLDYLVGNISNTSSDDKIRTLNQGTRSDIGKLLFSYQTILTEFENQYYNYNSFSFNNFTIIWQRYSTYNESNNTRSYTRQTVILLLDDNMNELTHFVIPYGLIDLDVDEDGNFYGLSLFTTSYGSSFPQSDISKDSRIILFNNFTVKINSTYNLKIRKTYFIPYMVYASDAAYRNNQAKIKKQPDTNTYWLAYGWGKSGTTSFNCTIYKFTINVGSQNEWKEFNATPNMISSSNIIINFREEEKTQTLIYFIARASSNVGNLIVLKIEDDNMIVFKNEKLNGITNSNITYDHICVTGYLQLYYFGAADNVLGYYNEGTSTLILTNNINTMCFANINGIVLGEYYCVNNTNWLGYGAGLLLLNKTDYKLLVGYPDFEKKIGLTKGISYNNQYNLFNILNKGVDTQTYYQFIYNPANYNGSSYISNESLIPQNIELTNDNLILFNRNLYNREIRNNTMTASVQIPNNLINEKAITNEILYSRTNFIMNNENRQIEKNVYETLNLNFINTWNMININPNKNDINLIGASRLVKSITTNDTTGQIDNILIYFDKDTKILNKNQFTLTKIKNGRYVYGFNLTIPNTSSKLLSIQFRANDNTVYQTIQENELNIKKGKTYYITQRVRVDNGQDRFIVYNGNKVTYNGKPLVY